MESFYDCVVLKHGLAFGIGTFIFLLTVFLVARRIIGFTLSLIFLLIALGLSWGIENQETVKVYFNKYFPGIISVKEVREVPAPIERPAPTTAPTPAPASVRTPSTTPEAPRKAEEVPVPQGQVEKQRQRMHQFPQA